jgi:hypothetical protein
MRGRDQEIVDRAEMTEETIVDMTKEVLQVEVMMIGDIGIEENSRPIVRGKFDLFIVGSECLRRNKVPFYNDIFYLLIW